MITATVLGLLVLVAALTIPTFIGKVVTDDQAPGVFAWIVGVVYLFIAIWIIGVAWLLGTQLLQWWAR
jgi:hypothetical protein